MGVLDETFSVMEDQFGEHATVELRPEGATQDVTEVNKGIARRVTVRLCTFRKGSGTCYR